MQSSRNAGPFLAVLALLLLIPGATAAHPGAPASSGDTDAAQGAHVHDEYVIPYNVALGGLGGGLLQGEYRLTIDYDLIVPDNDESGTDGEFSTTVSINVAGPGSNVVGTPGYSVSVPSTSCLNATQTQATISTASQLATSASWSYTITHNATATDWEGCLLLVRVSATSGGTTVWTFDAPVNVYNSEQVDADGFDMAFWLIVILQISILIFAVYFDLVWVVAFSIPALLSHVFFEDPILSFAEWVFYIVLSFGIEAIFTRSRDNID